MQFAYFCRYHRIVERFVDSAFGRVIVHVEAPSFGILSAGELGRQSLHILAIPNSLQQSLGLLPAFNQDLQQIDLPELHEELQVFFVKSARRSAVHLGPLHDLPQPQFLEQHHVRFQCQPPGHGRLLFDPLFQGHVVYQSLWQELPVGEFDDSRGIEGNRMKNPHRVEVVDKIPQGDLSPFKTAQDHLFFGR